MPVCKLHSFRDTVGVTAVVDVSGDTARHGGVNHSVVVQSEHVDTAVLRLVSLLSNISQISPEHTNINK